MSTAFEILALLDEAASSFEFPVLDNAHWRIAAGRLRGFRRDERWALVFEILLFHSQALSFSLEFYGYGPLVSHPSYRGGGFLDSVEVVEEIADDPLWDEAGEWIPETGERAVTLYANPLRTGTAGGNATAFPPDVILSHGDQDDEGAFLRALARELGLGRMMPESILLERLPDLRGAEVVRLTNWDHPDVAGGHPPSQSRALTECAKLVSGETSVVRYSHREDNVFWSKWADSPVYR